MAADEPTHAADQTGTVTEELRREGRRLSADAKEVAGEIRQEARRVADERKSAAAGLLNDVGDAVSAASDEIRRKGHKRTALCADYAASEVVHLAEQLDKQDFTELARGVGDFARRRPGLFYAASFIAGFAAIRFLRSESDGT